MVLRYLVACDVRADSVLLRRALANLLANAIRYGEAGTEVVLSVQCRGQGAEISVHSKGEAIAREDLSRIFERFYRCDPSRAGSREGSGLGLAIVRAIAEQHGGRVWATSDEAGTVIFLYLPGASMPLKTGAIPEKRSDNLSGV